MISSEQAEQIKIQLVKQLEKNLEGKDFENAKEQVELMTPEEIEEFLKKNGMAINSGGEKCIFCSIVFGDTPSYKIAENDSAAAVLEINPVSKGHTIIIPKNHGEELSKSVTDLTNTVSEVIKNKLSPKKVITEEQILFGHKILNIIPVYENESLKSKRQSVKKEELENLQKILSEKPKIKEEAKPKKEILSDKNTWLPKRFP